MAGQLPWGASSLNALLLFLNMNFVLLQENEKSRIIPLEAMEQHKNEGRETHKIKQKQLSGIQHIIITTVIDTSYLPYVRYCKEP